MKLLSESDYEKIKQAQFSYLCKRERTGETEVEKIFVQNAEGNWKLRAYKTTQQVEPPVGSSRSINSTIVMFYSHN